MTKAQLEAEVERLHKLTQSQAKENAWLLRELARLHTQGGTVPQAEHDAVCVQLRKANEQLAAYKQVRHNARGAGRHSDRTHRDRVLELRAEGLSYKVIAARLTEERVPAPGRGKSWCASSVWRICRET